MCTYNTKKTFIGLVKDRVIKHWIKELKCSVYGWAF